MLFCFKMCITPQPLVAMLMTEYKNKLQAFNTTDTPWSLKKKHTMQLPEKGMFDLACFLKALRIDPEGAKIYAESEHCYLN